MKALNESVKDRICDYNPITPNLALVNGVNQVTGLSGTAWQLVKFQGSDDSTVTPDDKRSTIAFGTNGRLTVRVDCNLGMGTWKSPDPIELMNSILHSKASLTEEVRP